MRRGRGGESRRTRLLSESWKSHHRRRQRRRRDEHRLRRRRLQRNRIGLPNVAKTGALVRRRSRGWQRRPKRQSVETCNSIHYKSGFERYSGTTPLTWDFSAWFSTSSSLFTSSSCSASHFSASSAATHPEPGRRVSKTLQQWGPLRSRRVVGCALTCTRDGLSVPFVLDIAGGEYALHGGLSLSRFCD